MKTILFLCTGNSCRSQMAHGLANTLLNQHYISYSAGIESHGLNQLAVKVMAEINIDISHYQSETLDQFDLTQFDHVIAVCEHAAANCPTFSDTTQVFVHPFDDPPKLAQQANSEHESLSYYRQVRDDIKDWIEKLPTQLNT